MIEVRIGNALEIPQGIIVHGCNSHGVMGAGIALEVKRCFPLVFQVYREEYEKNGLKLGELTFAEVAPFKIIVNAITQGDYGHGTRQVDYEAVVTCFENVLEIAQMIEDETGKKLDIVFPMIGAGLGGGNWNIIEKIIDETIPDHFNKILFKLP